MPMAVVDLLTSYQTVALLGKDDGTDDATIVEIGMLTEGVNQPMVVAIVATKAGTMVGGKVVGEKLPEELGIFTPAMDNMFDIVVAISVV